MQNSSVYHQAMSVYKIPTPYLSASNPQPKPAPTEPAPPPPVAEQAGQPDAPQEKISDKWKGVEVFAQKAVETANLEHEFCLVYERRRTTATRLADCVKRREDRLLKGLAEEWFRTEQKLAALQQRYAETLARREQNLKALGLGADDNA
jgi:hypothetical protein